MAIAKKFQAALIVVITGCVAAAVLQLRPAHAQEEASQQQLPPAQRVVTQEDLAEQPDDEEEAAPAAVEMDVSHDSPLIKTLYQATRETKEKAILANIAEAKGLIDSGADVKFADPQGRTALHWAVFGSSYNTKTSILIAYEELADDMLTRGIDINHEDMYNDTALDYLLYSPNFEMQTLLIEHGATSGFLAAFYHFFNDRAMDFPPNLNAAVAASRKADLTPGLTLSIRLGNTVYSDRSRTGDPIVGTVTYPLCKDGENISCKEGELLVPPGTRVNGTILFAQKAPDKYSRPRLVLDWSNIMHSNGATSPLYARVLDVDNARETVRNNEILGIVQPHASTKQSLAMAALGAANPIAGYTIKGIQTVYGLSIRREVLFPAGTDLQVQVVRQSMLKYKEPWPGWTMLPSDPQLQKVVQSAPLRTTNADNKKASDLTNLMFLGTQEQIISAFNEAGWIEADKLGIGSAAKVAQATIRQTGYNSAPVSMLRLNGLPPDLVFQKSLDTFAKRHHIRIWKLNHLYNGRQVWVGAATHDVATESGRGGTKWTHRIDPYVDRERDWVETDLLFAGTATGYLDVERPSAPHRTANATGDDIITDGKMTVVTLVGASVPATGDPTLKPRPVAAPHQ
ncbi:MAG TPA: LssY C-terminal domain-containing protein [Terriglobales bacterium]